MASVFLSYDHDDAARAAPIADALEKAGHSVWWDRHIEGGAEYNSEIEAAVEQADAVIVLWSEGSVQSPWVRDEAAEGRDQGKLVPVLLDAVKPPMGFRQFQTIDLTGWKSRQRLPKHSELLRAIERLDRQQEGKPPPKPQAHPATSPAAARRLAASVAAASAVAVLVVGALVYNPLGSGGSQAVAAVAPADSSAVSGDYARDLLAKLGRLQSAKAEEIQLAGAESRDDADFTFEVGASNQGEMIHASLVLRGRPSTILWSSDFERPAAQAGDLRQQLGFAATEVLDCAVEAHAAGLSNQGNALRSYLSGCAEMAQGDYERMLELVATFRRVVTAEPEFAAGWSKLLMAESMIGVTDDRRQILRQDIARARKLDAHMPATYLAEIELLPTSAYAAALALADRGLARNPRDSTLLARRGALLDGVGRTTDAINDARIAADLEPTSPVLRGSLVFALANGGRLDAAFRELDEADRLWPGSTDLYFARYILNARYGDPRVARQMGEGHAFFPSWTRARNYWEARLNPTPANVERSVSETRDAYLANREMVGSHFVNVLGTFGRHAELRKVMMEMPLDMAISVRSQLFRPITRGFWQDPQSLVFAKRIGLLQFWKTSGKWPDFCFEADLPYDCEKEAARLLA